MRRGLWRNLRAGLAIYRISFTEGLQYRLAYISSIFVGLFWVLIDITVFSVFFLHSKNGEAVGNGMSLTQLVTYLWIGQFLARMQFGGIEPSILKQIDSGDVGVTMCRPMNLYLNWFFQNGGKRTTALLFQGVPLLIIGAVMPLSYRLQLPASMQGFICFLLTALSACVLNFAWIGLVCAVRMNVQWGNGPMFMLFTLSQVLSGSFLPLQLWPDFMQKLLYLQPFAGMMDLPVRFYLGITNPGEVAGVLLLQILWSAVFITLGLLLTNSRVKKIVVQGG